MTEWYFNLFPELESERLMLRQLIRKDIGALYKIYSSEAVMKYYGMFPLEEYHQVERLVLTFQKGFEERRTIRWGIVLKETGELIGTCGYHNMQPRNYRAEIGYEIREDHWNKGYATEAIRELLNFGYEQLGLNRVEALVYPENLASHRALEKLGFNQEGVLRDYAYFRNVFQDLVMHSLLKREFESE